MRSWLQPPGQPNVVPPASVDDQSLSPMPRGFWRRGRCGVPEHLHRPRLDMTAAGLTTLLSCGA
jgi:hypothetical protein